MLERNEQAVDVTSASEARSEAFEREISTNSHIVRTISLAEMRLIVNADDFGYCSERNRGRARSYILDGLEVDKMALLKESSRAS